MSSDEFRSIFVAPWDKSKHVQVIPWLRLSIERTVAATLLLTCFTHHFVSSSYCTKNGFQMVFNSFCLIWRILSILPISDRCHVFCFYKDPTVDHFQDILDQWQRVDGVWNELLVFGADILNAFCSENHTLLVGGLNIELVKICVF